VKMLALALGLTVLVGQVSPTRRPLDRGIHGTPAEYYEKIVWVCETRPREYCSADGQDCWLEADVYISDVPCPKLRIK